MLWSKSFIITLKDAPERAESVSHRLMLRAGLIRPLISGVYSYLPLGLRVLRNVERVIRAEMDRAGAREVLLPGLQPLEIWLRSGRNEQMGETMIRFRDRRGRKICLGPTHEEVITDLARGCLSSYKQLPFTLYQIQTKYRDEVRPRFGLIRGCEFIMKDAYSFDKDEAGLDRSYRRMVSAYKDIFRSLGLSVIVSQADCGVMGGSESCEFMAPAESGEDKVEGKTAIEVGHIFKLGDKYSRCLGAVFSTDKGETRTVLMGCYGIGVSRLLAAIVEQHYDKDGIIWPREVAPYDALVIPLNITHGPTRELADKVYAELSKRFAVLLDDRDERPGVKFKDADLIGIPRRIVIGEKNLKQGKIEFSHRKDKKAKLVDKERIDDLSGLID